MEKLYIASVISFFLTGYAAHAQDAPVVLNPLHSDQGYMFDWIFFAIMIPVPLFFAFDLIRNQNWKRPDLNIGGDR